MEGNDFFLTLLLGGSVILGIVGTIAYYFARYGFSTPEEKLEKDKLSQKSKLDQVAVDPIQKNQGDSPAEVRPNFVAQTVEKSAHSLNGALQSTRQGFWGRIKNALQSKRLPDQIKDEVEEILFTSDLGVATVEKLLRVIESQFQNMTGDPSEAIRVALRKEMMHIFAQAKPVIENSQKELAAENSSVVGVKRTTEVILVVGVNGAGKTTSIGKLAYQLAQSGKKILIAAGDTFRAAAGDQLKVWSDRAQVEIFAPNGVEDPAAVAFSALEKGRSQNFDIVIIDTAGRLHTQKNLMEELKKVKRVLAKLDGQAPHQTILVLDANSGQNAIVQAREFHQALHLSDVVLTKMDGTAKGGVALSLAVELGLTPRWIGVGEGIEDLREFNPKEFVDAII